MATMNGQAHVNNNGIDGGSAGSFLKGPGLGLGPRGSSLARQQSIYSLTLDEFQNALGHDQGKNFGSMNMTEFLENIWSAEEGAMAQGKETGGLLRQASLAKQGSINLPRTLTGKTVDEVWRDIHQSSKPAAPSQQERQNTFGEMTLEDFLRKAGVVGDELDIATGGVLSSLGATPPVSSAQNMQSVEAQAKQHQAEWMDYQMKQQQQKHHQQMSQLMVQQHSAHPGIPHRPPPLIMKDPPERKPELSQSDDQSSLDEKGGGLTPHSVGGLGSTSSRRGKKRQMPTLDEQGKTVERKVKRMIKNRESAARSRARKQAYTQDLEEKIARLKEENAMLRKQLGGDALPPESPTLPKLRRTRTN
eukprot:TRINITY_DN1379_c0_g1_i1.p1 TRINITY_DN1379_c0_g1~~TRINITY_DN1379_c0_g1_i1.p1  ORF type:complete len:361 (+),score=87.74 TRINITY_DN1379_c0_g1_i1:65-1147(+)